MGDPSEDREQSRKKRLLELVGSIVDTAWRHGVDAAVGVARAFEDEMRATATAAVDLHACACDWDEASLDPRTTPPAAECIFHEALRGRAEAAEAGKREAEERLEREVAAAEIRGGFWARVEKGPGCWEWLGPQRGKGYGAISINGDLDGAHRYSWRLHFGLIPDGLLVCHRCDNPSCVRPDHLFLGTESDNTKDAIGKSRRNLPKASLTHCPQGHPYNQENTHVRPNGHRRCKACQRSHSRGSSMKSRRSAERTSDVK